MNPLSSQPGRRCWPLALAALAATTVASAAQAQAQSCPPDLSSLVGQIQTSDLQQMLTKSIDTVVADAGGLTQAITNANAALARVTATQANLGNAETDATRQYVNDEVVVFTARLNALTCRQGG